MDIVYKILAAMGAFFIMIGLVISTIFTAIDGFSVFILIPMMFVVIGICFVLGVCFQINKKKVILRKGKKYAAKIYGYVKNTTVLVNGSFTINVKVHYFDENHVEREAIIPTEFPEGSNQYAIGLTMDIYEYRGRYNWDPASVRNEVLKGEAELMDDKPVEPEKLTLTAVNCPNCGSSFQAAKGYASKCPYCGGYINV
ncbi:MAG: hypothetical protein Q4C57_05595 [Bacillota bacterium]|nr:hypothetical protein [Bacillota bacterium]